MATDRTYTPKDGSGITTSRQHEGDLCVTFEVNGEKFTFCIGKDTLKGKKSSDIMKLLGGNPIACGICCAQKSGTPLCLARCVYGDGQCCDSGKENCTQIGE